ncbi:MAG: response regulator [Deltaproteobacteria bacterium]|nr:response regulator [Deltaproteobacteria bacterium]
MNRTVGVLLVDDERAFVEVLAKRLASKGFEVAWAGKGSEALSLFSAKSGIDVVVLDLAMPGMDGLETLKKIKEIDPLVEIIMLTGHATVDSAVDAIKRGAFEYLMKPCPHQELMALIMKAVNRKRAREAKILDITMKPYLPEEEKNALIEQVLAE